MSDSHMSLKVNFSSCSNSVFQNPEGCATTKMWEVLMCDPTILVEEYFKTIYSEIAMLPQPI